MACTRALMFEFVRDRGIASWGISTWRDSRYSIHKYSSIGDTSSSSTPSLCQSWTDSGGFSSCSITLVFILLWNATSFSLHSSLLFYLLSLSIFCKSVVLLWVTIQIIFFLARLFIAGSFFHSRLESFYSTPTHDQLPPHSLPNALVSPDSSVYLVKKYSHSLSSINFFA